MTSHPATTASARAIPPAAPAFAQAWIDGDVIRLTAARDLDAGTGVTALVGGVPIGRAVAAAALAAGGRLDLRCGYYPDIGLPADIRFALDGRDDDAAPPVALTRMGQVIGLVGHGRIEEVELTLADGVIRGTGVNRTNAHKPLQPRLICRVNGEILRDVTVDRVTANPGGGVLLAFSVPIEAGDVRESGARYDILTLPNLQLVGSRSLAPPLLDAAHETRLAAVEARMSQMLRRHSLDLAALRDTLARTEARHLALIDGFAEYMLSLIYDRMAATGSPDRPGPEEAAAIAAFRQLTAELTGAAAPAAPPRAATVMPPDLARGQGWYGAETTGTGQAYVWMQRLGAVANPHPQAPVTLVSVLVQTLLMPEALPLAALFDGEPAEVSVFPDPEARPFRVNLRPAGGGAKPVHLIDLVAARAFSPQDLGLSPDRRQLSLAVNAVTFHYAGGGGGASGGDGDAAAPG
ncbi:MAG: hypothetical protein IE927_03235 [Rhodobacterales bacterium]|nr:hypothetical protein [Rhodobacterales bacterium]